ncbi:MAG: hypothetical protein IPJ77_19140 [Planctomycetes bacterium]|nr:hypothetical protein [Planctomycetota bacterium]
MNKRLPADAFHYFVALGPQRTHQAVATKFSVHRRTVVRTAERENWSERLAAIEVEARKTVDAQIVGDLAEMHLRHRKMLTAMAMRAAKAIQEFPLETGMDGVKTAAMVIKLERLLAGEPTDRSAVDIEAITKREIRELLILTPGGSAPAIDEEGDDDGE